jgi:hypothetical protein
VFVVDGVILIETRADGKQGLGLMNAKGSKVEVDERQERQKAEKLSQLSLIVKVSDDVMHEF